MKVSLFFPFCFGVGRVRGGGEGKGRGESKFIFFPFCFGVGWDGGGRRGEREEVRGGGERGLGGERGG